MKKKSRPAPTATRRTPKAKAPRPTPANTPVERAFTAQNGYADAFNEVVLDVIFTDPAGKEFRVPAFWAGGKVWKVRYASPLTGTHSFRTECKPANDAGLHARYHDVVWTLRHLTKDLSRDEQHAIFFETARRVYGVPVTG